MIEIGMIGVSQGNGHPYSFSAIFNGYDKEAMQQSEWQNIFNYLEKEPKENFGIDGARISHIWSQSITESQKIAKASKIPIVVGHYEEMIASIDAVIIARDDWSSHYPIAKAFLEKGKFVLIDKPLSLDPQELEYFQHYILQGKLMSFSSLHFSPELDELKENLSTFGDLKLIRGITPNSWEKYAIHLLDGIAGVLSFHPTKITKNASDPYSVCIQTKEGFIIEIDCLGKMDYPMLQLEFFSKENYCKANCLNAFASFKRLLTYFTQAIKGQTNLEKNLYTLELMKILQHKVEI